MGPISSVSSAVPDEVTAQYEEVTRECADINEEFPGINDEREGIDEEHGDSLYGYNAGPCSRRLLRAALEEDR